MVSPELQEGLNEALERTGGMGLLDKLGEVSPVDREHSERVGQLAMQVELATGARDERIIEAGFKGSLHDAGKVSPRVQELISLPRRLKPEELEEVRRAHTEEGAKKIWELEVAEEYKSLIEEAALVALYHHHTPKELLRLKTLISTTMIRRIHIIDQFDALQDENRPYRSVALSDEEALADIEHQLAKNGNGLDGVASGTIELLRRTPVI